MKTWSLRAQLTLWAALITATALGIFSLGTAVSLYFRQRTALDDQLRGNARIFFSELLEHGAPAAADFEAAERLLHEANPAPVAIAYGPPGAALLQASPADFAAFAASLPVTPAFSAHTVPGARWRVGVFADHNIKLVLAADLQPARHVFYELLTACLVALPVVLLVVAGGSRWIAQRALTPIAQITAAASAITTSNLHARLPAPATDDEIGRHTQVLNAMFDRLDRGFDQASRFTADAAHELRTPLTILRGEIEQALRRAPADFAHEKTLLSLLEQTDRLQRISDNLLLLARLDAGYGAVDFTAVNLSALVHDAAEDAGLLAASRQLAITADLAPEITVSGNELLLRRLLLNLVDNAVSYNRPDGSVRLSLRKVDGNAEFAIANTGPGIPPELHADVFQRFFRVARDRSRGAGGSGLGLSLCREIVLAHHGTITLTSDHADLTCFTVRLAAVT